MKQSTLLIDRISGKIYQEKIYGESVLRWLYKENWLSHCVVNALSRCSLFSKIYGAIQKTSWSRRKIVPFIEEFHVNAREFLDPVSSYASFNAFFTRKLRPEVRPIDPNPEVAMIPADGRYLFFEEIQGDRLCSVKNQSFSLHTLLQDPDLAKTYLGGT